MYKYCHCTNHMLCNQLKDVYHISKLLISIAFFLVGVCHLFAEFMVVHYSKVYYVDFNSLMSNIQIITLSWVKIVGIVMMIQGILLWKNKPAFSIWSLKITISQNMFPIFISLFLIFVLFHPQANLYFFFWLPSVLLIIFYFLYYVLYLVIYLIVNNC